MTILTLDTLGKGRAKGEFNRQLRRLSRLHQRADEVFELSLKIWLRPATKRGRKMMRWDVRSNISARRQEIGQIAGKTK